MPRAPFRYELFRAHLPYLSEKWFETQRNPRFNPLELLSDYLTFQAIMFQGGGVKGSAYSGVYEILSQIESGDFLARLERVGGTSAGSITAGLIAVGYNADEIRDIMSNMDFRKFCDKGYEHYSRLNPLYYSAKLRMAFAKNHGAFRGKVFYDWMGDLIEAKTGQRHITFKQLAELAKTNPTLKSLATTGFNLNTESTDVFSAETTPDMPILDAIRISMSFPFVFESVEYNGCHYVDGGVAGSANAPQLFHDPSTTLHIRVDPIHKIDRRHSPHIAKSESNKGLFARIFAIFGGMRDDTIDVDPLRTIAVDDHGVDAVDFGISKTYIEELIQAGRRAAKKYASNYVGAYGSSKVVHSFEEKWEVMTHEQARSHGLGLMLLYNELLSQHLTNQQSSMSPTQENRIASLAIINKMGCIENELNAIQQKFNIAFLSPAIYHRLRTHDLATDHIDEIDDVDWGEDEVILKRKSGKMPDHQDRLPKSLLQRELRTDATTYPQPHELPDLEMHVPRTIDTIMHALVAYEKSDKESMNLIDVEVTKPLPSLEEFENCLERIDNKIQYIEGIKASYEKASDSCRKIIVDNNKELYCMQQFTIMLKSIELCYCQDKIYMHSMMSSLRIELVNLLKSNNLYFDNAEMPMLVLFDELSNVVFNLKAPHEIEFIFKAKQQESLRMMQTKIMDNEAIESVQRNINGMLRQIRDDSYSFRNEYRKTSNLPLARATYARVIALEKSVDNFISKQCKILMTVLDVFCGFIRNTWVPDCLKNWRQAHKIKHDLSEHRDELQQSTVSASRMNIQLDDMLGDQSSMTRVLQDTLQEADSGHLQTIEPFVSEEASLQAYLDKAKLYFSQAQHLKKDAPPSAPLQKQLSQANLDDMEDFLDMDDEDDIDMSP